MSGPDENEYEATGDMCTLIGALLIFMKYRNVVNPTHCEHDLLYVVGVTRDEMSDRDIAEVERRGFFWVEGDSEVGGWQSYHFGSA